MNDAILISMEEGGLDPLKGYPLLLEMVPRHLKDISSVLITCFSSPLFSPVLLVSQGCPDKVLQT